MFGLPGPQFTSDFGPLPELTARFKIGACWHGDRCSRLHNKPTCSQVRPGHVSDIEAREHMITSFRQAVDTELFPATDFWESCCQKYEDGVW
ncbi:Splicing factor U2AF 26 kDa subunit [Heterocephalus glaber]|uniref:Splicing factor U2AF 26 kDa subunit n=1 Tax=Heterocephalus glaber TaxID=10181 RepID=G5BXN2_HETGA|nr:Splicing factor U2AF 26 kDa subunit [Heterocephalus glaber]